ncbi:putative eukaryotic translation initiation factor 4 gamma [Trypanosoma rangeli]|uniref:Putative eukaryotic translation initiation factor 4 gamma n=1 Tax=Trypanosoma rangeli TaxID=5698 RepID=A0A422NEE1_TRYRA|nr:putative eukaryotic translation initiation factor 4 gamma [Trypanosoma rangeli]RNF03782.1 putative eukaryotic translation initiation factor 4 gamma [Trypanosoma rangeli]|eukprot:RNF03782.1 putative eukaryotic translation initiation factor 4 gamma [Trypanosoma rangeli]
MHVYSIQQILEVQSLYRDAPYPGFSLEEACRRKRMTQTKLVRGANAWVARGSAKTTEEWVERLVQGSLNKLSTANFDAMVAKLQTDVIFSTNETLKIAVQIIFNKALDEPECSKLYGGVCYKLAEFEVGLTAVQQPTDGKKHSKLRNAVVGIAQEEFLSRRKMPSMEGLTEDEMELRRATFMRRKRANMKFIGELFMHKVLSQNTMMNIIQTIMQEAEKGGHPTSEDIEFLTELFLTIGESLDAVPELRLRVDRYFELLEVLKEQKDVYPPRIRFKILDIIELRSKFNWERRKAGAPKTSPPTQRETPRVTDKTAMRPSTSASSNGAKKGRYGGAPDAASQQAAPAPAPASAPAKAAAGVMGGRSWSNIVKTALIPDDAPVTRVVEPVNFEARVSCLFQQWVAECSNDFIPEWMDEFRDCQRQFDSEDALCKAAAAVVVREACMTTKKEAQREASSFLIVGLFLADDEVLDGFAMALVSAIEEGILEDVPKFSERFINMLRITSGENTIADVYYDTARVLCTAYALMQEPDEVVLDTMMGFWEKIPCPATDENALLPLEVVQSLMEMSTGGQAPLTGRIIASLYSIGLVHDETVNEWLATPHDSIGAAVVEAFKHATK